MWGWFKAVGVPGPRRARRQVFDVAWNFAYYSRFAVQKAVNYQTKTGVSGMYAVIKTGGKQYRVAPGEKIKIETVEAEVGATIVLDQVLMVADGEAVKVGSPTVAGAKVSATVVSHGRGPKIRIFKMRRRKHYQKTQGHRQNYTEIRVDAINE
jgi:large subunit ribosomal protein L21